MIPWPSPLFGRAMKSWVKMTLTKERQPLPHKLTIEGDWSRGQNCKMYAVDRLFPCHL